jgi:hypothetical protein
MKSKRESWRRDLCCKGDHWGFKLLSWVMIYFVSVFVDYLSMVSLKAMFLTMIQFRFDSSNVAFYVSIGIPYCA